AKTSDSGDFAEDVVPALAPPPTVTRKFKPAGWHRPRKQYIRMHQWNHEIIGRVIKKKTTIAEPVIRIFGLPSSEYLDLLSMREFCEAHERKVLYLGFNASYAPPAQPGPGRRKREAIDLYAELQAQRMIDASSFVHPSSILYPDRFELIRDAKSRCR